MNLIVIPIVTRKYGFRRNYENACVLNITKSYRKERTCIYISHHNRAQVHHNRAQVHHNRVQVHHNRVQVHHNRVQVIVCLSES